ncbi:MAG TPA: permease [Holophagaceae bacterium]|nr:permease [Holophagaceae bacterium]
MNATLRRAGLILALILLVHGALWMPLPAVAGASARHWAVGLGEVLAIVPSVLVLLALFDVWVPKALIERNLGADSGTKGVLLALLLGTGAAGPIYAAFPIALSLREKGARTANLVIFLGAWATIKLPMLMMESAFLGTRFAMLRLALTVPGILAVGFLLERLDPLPTEAPEPAP